MANLRILRITPGGTKRGKDRTLINKSNNIISIGWSYIPNLIEKKNILIFMNMLIQLKHYMVMIKKNILIMLLKYYGNLFIIQKLVIMY